MNLTRGEGWWLTRRRLGQTQVETAQALRISEDRYRRWELDREPAPMPSRCGVARNPLTPGERAALERRRRGWTLEEAAHFAGVSRQTIWKAERDRTSGVAGLLGSYAILTPARPTTAAPIRLRTTD